jgi:hypothetical protein
MVFGVLEGIVRKLLGFLEFSFNFMLISIQKSLFLAAMLSIHTSICQMSQPKAQNPTRDILIQPSIPQIFNQNSNLPTLLPHRYSQISNMIASEFTDKDGFKLQFDETCTEIDKKFFREQYPKVDLVANQKLHCTTCDVHIGTAPISEKIIRTHQVLGVTQCNKCFAFYVSLLGNREVSWNSTNFSTELR